MSSLFPSLLVISMTSIEFSAPVPHSTLAHIFLTRGMTYLLVALADLTDVALGASGLWLGTWTGAGGTATPA